MRRTVTDKSVDPRDQRAIAAFRFELPSLLVSIDLAEIIAAVLRSQPVSHPVLWFAFDKAPASVVENLLLRIPELIDHLDRAHRALGKPGLYTGVKRNRHPVDPTVHLACRLRQGRVAHRVRMRHAGSPAWDQLCREHESVYSLLRLALSVLDRHAVQLEEAGVDLARPSDAAKKLYDAFTPADVRELVALAQQLPPNLR